MARARVVPRVSGTGFKRHKKYTWCIAWAMANIGWSLSFIDREIPGGDFLFLGYLFLSLYGWLKWFKEDIDKWTLRAERERCKSKKVKISFNRLVELSDR